MNKDKKNYYAIIPANVRYDKRLSPLTRLIYGEITALSNEKGYCFATNAYFANLYSMSNVSISRCISELKEHNYIRVVYDIKEKNVDKRKIYINNTENKKLENEELKNNEEITNNKEININIQEYKENESINKNNNTNKNDDAFSLAKIKLVNRIKLNDDTDLSNNIKEYNQNCLDGIKEKVKDNNIINNKNNNIINSNFLLSEFDSFVLELCQVFNNFTYNNASKISELYGFKSKEKQELLLKIFNERKYDWRECIKYAKLKAKEKNNIPTLWLDFLSFLKIYLREGDKEKLIKPHYTEEELLEIARKLQKQKREREKALLEESKKIEELERALGRESMTLDEIIEATKEQFKHLKRK
ncbi:helix-turn-helix domain-containing protein [Brachyspira pilosicoli]|uniref:helix-turn-helix domain-containing protein n=1 Tax=Brachyspira pilosicoli TaxID=52584 RepID=UPI001C665652|nr:helix-turn-helix domain-containing protein [Brachyspira pilosicoli]MBW5397690.1 helix-turn-helix domain-containing protein [Brachyspira pilosicoli]